MVEAAKHLIAAGVVGLCIVFCPMEALMLHWHGADVSCSCHHVKGLSVVSADAFFYGA